MDDSFELEYADELDAIDDFCPDDDLVSQTQNPPKSKRSLQFESPRAGGKNQDELISKSQNRHAEEVDDVHLDLSPPSPQPLVINSDDHSHGNERTTNRKRQPSEDDWFEEETDVSLFELAQVSSSRKKQRLTADQEVGLDEPDSHTIRLIEQIQQHRMKSHTHVEDSDDAGKGHQIRFNDAEDMERPRVSKRIPKEDFVSTVGYGGERVYMKLWAEDVLEAEYLSLGEESRSSGLLTVPVCVMKEKMEEEKSRRAFQESVDLSASIERQLDDPMVEAELSTTEDISSATVAGDVEESDGMQELTDEMRSLWVEKYAPRKYTELLSEESINRSLLHWLKLWDFVVFGKDVPKPQKTKNFKKDKEKDQKKFKKFQAEVEENLDAHNRPQQMVALLCGPPGLGKTTLAHIVARHAGYNVVEMNASDDRSVDVFRNKLESATQMKSVTGADPRPNCLVIDEIDGAPLPAINTLLNTVKKSENEKTSKKKKDKGLLLRPIICVCNDQYVPALRQLRQMALVLNFPQTEPSRLASRLYEVVRIEQLKADLNALLALCERTDNDIRSCLNTLQFVRQKQKELTLRDVQTMSVGQKDRQKSLFTVWYEVFSMPRPKKNRFVSIQDLAAGKQEALTNNISPPARYQHILELCQSAGESERIMQGLQENYLEAKSKDPHLHGLSLANEWLCFADHLNQYTAHSQDYSVMKFTPFLPIVFHFLYASNAPPRVQFPHKQAELHQSVTKTLNLMTTLISDMTPVVRKFVNPRNMVLDLLPPLLDVLQPTLRPVNAQLYSAREKEELLNVVNIMIAYNMTYQQEKSPEGQYVYSLDPNVEEVVKFSGLKQRKQLTYAAKQMIAREIDLEKMRKSERPAVRSEPEQSVKPAESETRKKTPAVPNHLQKLEAKRIADEKPSVNFFGNFVRTKRKKVEKEEDKEPKQDPKKKSLLDTLIWFHFKEGFSNAVRRNVKVQDLL
ncbi:chromosome transmission fidelity protein 18 homolog [Aplysia californica]|uniref:Chromosome transmission fidelity protein 18 homolog n=1 Tax=Aplysia californica TaxID=6500 RepID=A0ABM1A322_APLCA|nr:chromosome transmission fidelity protein 18 homolog [Aplysia californica]